MTFELALGPRVRMSPFFEATVADGARAFTVYNHMYMPVSYGDPAGEYERLIHGAAMWDVAVERQVEIQGRDAVRLADYLCTRNVLALEVGQGRYAPICDHEGVLLNDPIVMKLDDQRVWFSIADSDVLLWARAVAREGGFEVRVVEPDVSPLAVQGPKAEAVVAALLGEWVRELRPFGFRPAECEGIPLVVGRSGWSKQGGFELYLCDGTKGPALWRSVREAGAPFGIGPGAPNPVERVESGLLSYGADTDAETNPFEVRLGRYVDLTGDADFIGKRALARIAREGPRRRQVGLFVDGSPLAPNARPWPVERAGVSVGRASAAAYSPRLGRNIALALIETAAAEAGGAGFVVLADDGPRAAEITSLPFC